MSNLNNPLAGVIALGGTQPQQKGQGQDDPMSLGGLMNFLMGRLHPQSQQQGALNRPGIFTLGQLARGNSPLFGGGANPNVESVPGYGTNGSYGGGLYMVNNVPSMNPGDPSSPTIVSPSYIGPPISQGAAPINAYATTEIPGGAVQSTFRPTSQDD